MPVKFLSDFLFGLICMDYDVKNEALVFKNMNA